jgi:hypothetical protein
MRSIALLILVPLLSACAGPTGPGVMVLPGQGSSFEQFQTDDASCRQWAGGRAHSWGQQHEYDIAYQQCMYAKGHRLPGVQPPPRGASTVPPSTPR